jgi:hypothetical protein
MIHNTRHPVQTFTNGHIGELSTQVLHSLEPQPNLCEGLSSSPVLSDTDAFCAECWLVSMVRQHCTPTINKQLRASSFVWMKPYALNHPYTTSNFFKPTFLGNTSPKHVRPRRSPWVQNCQQAELCDHLHVTHHWFLTSFKLHTHSRKLCSTSLFVQCHRNLRVGLFKLTLHINITIYGCMYISYSCKQLGALNKPELKWHLPGSTCKESLQRKKLNKLLQQLPSLLT